MPPDLKADEIAKLDWQGYLEAEKKLFEDVRKNVTDKLEPEERTAQNRYFEGSPIYPPKFAQDWNRSYVLNPDGPPAGAVVLLHGLTDTPYSLRHVARAYRARGWVAIGIRLPGHGTVPAGLAKVDWEDWSEATRLAVREARRRAPQGPLHLVGFSNGGALAMKYALEALSDKVLARPDRLVLISPMIGITAFARFAGFFGWPAVFPAFANAAWLSVVPEFNPFKYNSFPINGARQSSLLTRVLQDEIADAARTGRIKALAPVLTFQSVADFTVSTRAIVTALYANLPANGSELVLFDVNRHAKLTPLLRSRHEGMLDRLLPDPRGRTGRRSSATPAPGRARWSSASSKPARRPSRRARSGCPTRTSSSRSRTWRFPSRRATRCTAWSRARTRTSACTSARSRRAGKSVC